MSVKTNRITTKKFRQAQALQQRGELQEARSLYEYILASNPKHADSLHYLGLLIYRLGENDKAIGLISRAIELQPDNIHAIKNLGNVFLELESLDKAIICYQKVIKIDQQDVTTLNNLCVALRQKGKVKSAINAGQKATRLAPDYQMAWYSLGNAYKVNNEFKQAIHCFTRATDIDPHFSPAHDSLCQSTFKLEQNSFFGRRKLKKTLAAYQRWQTLEPDNVLSEFMIKAIKGEEKLTRAPDDVVRHMFDRSADKFEEHLGKLEYRVPGLIKSVLLETLGAGRGDLFVFDGGCGTGLAATALKPYASSLTGVDLSPGMLDKAKKLKLYDELIESELSSFLQSKNNTFDLTVFADTFCYFGDLKGAIKATSKALRAGGTILFSVELWSLNPEPVGYRLHPHGRYCHTRPYIETTLLSYGFSDIQCRQETLRMELGRKVPGLMVTAHIRKT